MTVNQSERFDRLRAAVPKVRDWIEETIAEYSDRAKPVASFGWERLTLCYSTELLERAKVVLVDAVPSPPLDQLGLPEFSDSMPADAGGITFMDTFFARRDQNSESLHFHELIHVLQWERLGADNFLLAYGLGLAQFGYRHSPLEAMAYDLQAQFDAGQLSSSVFELVKRGTDAIRIQIQRIL
jgi:hypothetical protein